MYYLAIFLIWRYLAICKLPDYTLFLLCRGAGLVAQEIIQENPRATRISTKNYRNCKTIERFYALRRVRARKTTLNGV